ncbi:MULTISPECIES: hypothetical protein [unclassified Aureimonas]|uniref:hypothetical protein n=1 Tax=unclassified Aureimonas TaxID=2615206 RepID=UPI0006FEB227|nr:MULTISPECIES: hypothetical protein [unclassified Aureimonas]KQT65791.1 hypothetical protein ASG62_21715 [Aureimonas sp. Leaf427]KQT74790.1 hypothetical protein ASG54_16775 [Aureimonas sp. Leaf460]
MAALLRFLFVIPFGFVAACAAAAFALLWPFVDLSGAGEGDPFFWVQIALGFGAQAAQVGSAALVPWGVFMLATEILGLRSLIFHVVAGLVAGFLTTRIAYGAELPHGSVQTALVVAGLAFALVYWIIAGRGAGRWRKARRPRPEASLERATPL